MLDWAGGSIPSRLFCFCSLNLSNSVLDLYDLLGLSRTNFCKHAKQEGRLPGQAIWPHLTFSSSFNLSAYTGSDRYL